MHHTPSGETILHNCIYVVSLRLCDLCYTVVVIRTYYVCVMEGLVLRLEACTSIIRCLVLDVIVQDYSFF